MLDNASINNYAWTSLPSMHKQQKTCNSFISVWNSWMGIGWGRSMLSSDSLIVWANPLTKSLVVSEAVPSGSYSPPISSPNKIIIYGGNLTQTIVENAMILEFYRPTRPNTGSLHAQININDGTNHIYAFNANPSPAAQSGWKDWHGANRGAYVITYATSQGASLSPDSIYAKRIHGIAMAAVWLVIFPISIFYTRYFRFVPGWLRIHIVIQSIGAGVGVLGATLYIILSLSNNFKGSFNTSLIFRPHTILGLIIVTGTFVQGAMGVLNRLTLSTENIHVDRSRPLAVRLIHVWLGRILILSAFVQAGLGIQILYPLSEVKFRGIEAWIAYVTVVAFWVILVIASDTYYQTSLTNVTQKLIVGSNSKHKLVGSNLGMNSPDAIESLTSRDASGTKSPLSMILGPESIRLRTDLITFTWQDIAENVMHGNHLVVANGRYVFSIDAWITSHPGGRLILYSVAGTDITNDFFNEAGFDAEAFIPKPAVKKQAKSRKLPPLMSSSGNMAPLSEARSSVTLEPRSSGRRLPPSELRWSTFAQMSAIEEKEWGHVIRARRTHAHTRLAVSRLSTLLVGELVPSPKMHESGRGLRAESGELIFDPTEYRRYALVSSEMATPPTGTATHVCRLKFCVLYPYDTRTGEPEQFMPGQCIEIQARINSKYISRYYTPISGNPSSFEVFVKVYPTGMMSSFLSKQTPGDQQFKIRSPLGLTLVDPERPLSPNTTDWCYERMVFIVCGSGIVPALQLLQMLFLPTFVPLHVWQAYDAMNPDELELVPGDWVIARQHYYDGWAEGVNLRTQQEGMFPLTVTSPRVGSSMRVAIVNATRSSYDVFGTDILNGSLLAYPYQIQLTHCFSHGIGPMSLPRSSIAVSVPGAILDGRVSVAAMASALDFVGWITEQEYQNDAIDSSVNESLRQRVVVCGTKAFEGIVYDELTSRLGLAHRSILLLPDEVY